MSRIRSGTRISACIGTYIHADIRIVNLLKQPAVQLQKLHTLLSLYLLVTFVIKSSTNHLTTAHFIVFIMYANWDAVLIRSARRIKTGFRKHVQIRGLFSPHFCSKDNEGFNVNEAAPRAAGGARFSQRGAPARNANNNRAKRDKTPIVYEAAVRGRHRSSIHYTNKHVHRLTAIYRRPNKKRNVSVMLISNPEQSTRGLNAAGIPRRRHLLTYLVFSLAGGAIPLNT